MNERYSVLLLQSNQNLPNHFDSSEGFFLVSIGYAYWMTMTVYSGPRSPNDLTVFLGIKRRIDLMANKLLLHSALLSVGQHSIIEPTKHLIRGSKVLLQYLFCQGKIEQ